jgi:hypothetical protein
MNTACVRLLLLFTTWTWSAIGALNQSILSDAQLRCAEAGVSNWREVLLYGDSIGYADYPIDGRTRHTLSISFRKKIFVFVFMFPDQPGALEPGAWHGCAVYDLGYWT